MYKYKVGFGRQKGKVGKMVGGFFVSVNEKEKTDREGA